MVKFVNWEMIIIWSRWKHWKYVKVVPLTTDWKIYFSYSKNIHFACSRINLMYLGHLVLKNRPTSREARKENLESGSLQGQTEYRRFIVPVRKSLHLHDCFFQIAEWCVACCGKTDVLFHFVWKLVILKTRRHESLWAFLICIMLSVI